MTLRILKEISAFSEVTNITKDTIRHSNHVLIRPHVCITFGYVFERWVKNYIKTIGFCNVICGVVIWQNQHCNNVAIFLFCPP